MITLLAAVAFAGTLTAAATTVSTVAELQDALLNASTDDEIILSAGETPPKVYDLSTEDCMHSVGHLYVTKKITLRGATGNRDDVVLLGSTNRILYLNKSGSTIRDLTFKNGDCTANKESSIAPVDNLYGGGICLGSTSTHNATISNCVFTGCKAKNGGGVALYCGPSSTSVRYGGNFMDCLFTNCTATARGGASHLTGSLRKCRFVDNSAGTTAGAAHLCVYAENCVFRGNTATYGGAIGGESSPQGLTNYFVTGCSFYTNSATYGGAITCHNKPQFAAVLIVTNCYFEGNSVSSTSGSGGAVYTVSNVVDCTFVRNSGYDGGGAKTCALTGCRLIGNQATRYGGGAQGSTLTDCEVSGNWAFDHGGGAYQGTLTGCRITGNTVGGGRGYGGGASSATLIGCVIAGNHAAVGGGGTYNSKLSFCTNRTNISEGKSGTEMRNGTATDCLFDGIGYITNGCFYTCGLDRCRIYATNCYLFVYASGATNCLIAGGTTVTLFHNAKEGTELFNCTIVDNTNLAIRIGGSTKPEAQVVNCLFYGNNANKSKPYDIADNAEEAVKSFRNCIFRVYGGDSTHAPGSGNYDYWGNDAFDPGFVGAAGDPQNPYAITRKSPAFHVKSEALGVTGDASSWTANDTDIRGEGFPRLRNGKVDIGCYQCWLEPPGLAVTIR